MPTIDAKSSSAEHRRLSAAEARLRAILHAAVDAIVTIDQRGIIDSVNPTTERMFGYSSDELIGRNVRMLMPTAYREHHDDYLQRYLATGQPQIIGIGREVEAERKDGSVFPVDLAVSEFEIAGKRMFTGLIRDISDRRAAEREARLRLEELAHAGRLADLGLTTSTIAHEVNQPLTAIVSFAHACQRMLDAGNLDGDLLRDALKQIAGQGERASTIIARIRDTAKKRQSVPERLDLNACARSVLAMLASELRDGQVKLDLHFADSLAAVKADRVQVEQVIVNLIRNAVEAMNELPSSARLLEIVTRNGDATVQLSVRDTGPGLGPEGAEKVFESFFTTKPYGMGVGLSICRSLAETHGGRLWAESDDQAGATFHFSLPVLK